MLIESRINKDFDKVAVFNKKTKKLTYYNGSTLTTINVPTKTQAALIIKRSGTNQLLTDTLTVIKALYN